MTHFATNLPKDTVPNINFQIKGVLKNLGNNPLPVGTPVRLHITGPNFSSVCRRLFLLVGLATVGQSRICSVRPNSRFPTQ